MRVGGLEAHAHVDPDALYYFFHTPGERGFGETQTSYSNPEFDEIVVRAGESGDLEDRRELLAEAQRILARDVPMIVTMYPDGIWALRPDAYQGWIADFGHSPLTKRSFLPDYAAIGDDSIADDVEEAAEDFPWAWVAVAVAVVAVIGAVLVRRRKTSEDYE